MVLRAASARRIATATAFGGGGATLLGASTVGFLYLQARLAHKAVGFTHWQPPQVNGVYGHGSGPPLSFMMMGDSTAAGFAVTDGVQTPGVLLASGISAVAERPVRLQRTARVGATAKDLMEQVEKVRGRHVDLAVIFIGANDVIHRVRPADSVRHLQSAVRELVGGGTAVVVGTCPDLGTVQPIGQPLRSIARRASRQLAAAQTIAVVEEGGRTVSMSNLLTDDFQAYPDELFGPDRFHPSARGYAHAAAAVLPSACAALGLLPELEILPDPTRGEGALPIDRAAVEAAEEAGTEVSGAKVGGRERGPRGRWATLIRRRFGGHPADSPAETENEPDAGGPADTDSENSTPGVSAGAVTG